MGRGPDHLDRLVGQHVAQIVLWPAAVLHGQTILVEQVVVARVGVAADVPLVPAGGHAIALRHVPVEVLAEHRGAVARAVQPSRDGRLLETEPAKRLEPAPRRLVAHNVRVVPIPPAQDRGARRTAPRIADEEVLEHRALVLEQGLGLGHEGVSRNVLVIGDNGHDVRSVRVGLCVAGDQAEAQPEDLGGGRRPKPPVGAARWHVALRLLTRRGQPVTTDGTGGCCSCLPGTGQRAVRARTRIFRSAPRK